MNKDLATTVEQNFTVLILAAGKASRFGGDKRRALFESRKTLLEKTISQFQPLGLKLVVCLSADDKDDSLEAMLHGNAIECVRCARAKEGMGSTLAESVNAVGDVAGVVVALADMPGLRSQTVSLLLTHADSEHIVCPVFDGQRGHPVVFGKGYLPLLKLLSGDRGANQLLREYAQNCISVPVNDPGVLLDVDTPADLDRVRRMIQERSS